MNVEMKTFNIYFKNLFFILSIFLLNNCTKSNSNFFVTGNVENGAGKKISLSQLTTDKEITVDSVIIDSDNHFELEGYIEYPGFFTLTLDNKKIIYLVAAPNNNIEIKSNSTHFKSEYIVKGSYDSQLIRDMVLSQQKTTSKLEELAAIYKDSLNHPDVENIIKRRNKKREELIDQQREITIELIKDNPTSLASLMALYQHLDPYTPILMPESDFEFFEMVDSNLMALYPESEAVQSLNKWVVKNRIKAQSVSINDKAPEIALPNPQGEILKLSDLKGNYVLIQFWASWNKESREENQYLVNAQDGFKDQPFEIYQVSLDKDSAAWINAINEDNIDWGNVSDLQFWNSVAARIYNVKQLPFNFLINPEGIVIDTDLRGIEIERKLKEIFN